MSTRAGSRRSSAARTTSFVHESEHAAPVRVRVLAPACGTPERVTVVMPGTLRNAEDYARSWGRFAATSLVVVPEFSRAHWPGARRYALGAAVEKRDGRRALTPRAGWGFGVVEAIHARVRRRFRIEDERFDIWGHSAGAQFVHRMALLQPDAPVRRYVAASAGWYTAPDPTTSWPYGVADPGLGLDAAQLRRFAAQPLTLMRGTADVERDGHLRTTPGAEAQGPNRYERAAFMLAAGRAVDPACRWRLLDVEGAGHAPTRMGRAAQELLRAEAA